MNRSLKRISGIILIIIFSIVEIAIVLIFIFDLFYPSSKDGISQPAYSFLFVALLFAFPLWYGIRLLKETKKSEDKTAEAVSPRDFVTVEVFLSAAEYKRISILLSYQTPVRLFLTFISGFMLVALISNYIPILDYRWIFGAMFFIMPILVYYQAGKQYKSNNFLKETIEYEFNVDNIITKGESFTSTVALKNLHKVKETNGLLLLYTNHITAFIIPKDRFKSEDDLIKVRQMLGQV